MDTTLTMLNLKSPDTKETHKDTDWHTPANCINVLQVGLFLRLAQTVPESDKTLSEALVDGTTRDRNGSSERQRQEACREEEQALLSAAILSSQRYEMIVSLWGLMGRSERQCLHMDVSHLRWI